MDRRCTGEGMGRLWGVKGAREGERVEEGEMMGGEVVMEREIGEEGEGLGGCGRLKLRPENNTKGIIEPRKPVSNRKRR